MSAAAPLLLLPPSKGKASGGDGPAYGRVVGDDGALGPPRRQVLRGVLDELPDLDDATVARLAGVGSAKAAEARELLSGLADAPTLPAHRRYTGVVHGNADLAALDPAALEVDVRIVSALAGLARLDEPLPDYRLELGARLPTLGGLGPFWRRALAEELLRSGAGRRVWDLLPGEHRRVWDPEVRARLEVVEVAFVRPDGRPANAARTKVAKGRLAAALIARPGLRPRDLARTVDLGDGWRIAARGDQVTATYAPDRPPVTRARRSAGRPHPPAGAAA